MTPMYRTVPVGHAAAAALALLLAACTSGPSPSGNPSAQPSLATASTRPSAASSHGQSLLPGRIVYSRFSGEFGWESDFLGTYIIATDGSGEAPLPTPNHADTFVPTWSPDGTKLAVQVWDESGGILGRPAITAPDGSGFTIIDPPGLAASVNCTDWSPDATKLLCFYDDDPHPDLEGIYEIAIDGSTATRLTVAPYPSVVGTAGECGGGDYGASYSPDGQRFAFIRKKCGVMADPSDDETAEVWVGNIDGTGLKAITAPGIPNSHGPGVAWSPDGRSILFGDPNGAIRLVTPDGSSLSTVPLDGPFGMATAPSWSPDGTHILFSLYVRDFAITNLFIANADGSHVTQITTTPNAEEFATWGP
jgi:Tol biopolymer transport system component